MTLPRPASLLVIAMLGLLAGCGRDSLVDVRRDAGPGGSGGTGGIGGGGGGGAGGGAGADASEVRPGDGGTDVVPGTVMLSLLPSNAPPLPVGQTLQWRAFVIIGSSPRDVTMMDVLWSVDNPAIASVSERGGRVTALAAGRTRLSASHSVLGTASTDVVVIDAQVRRLVVTPMTLQLSAGDRRALRAQAIYGDGLSADITTAAGWRSGDQRIARVGTGIEQPGLVTAVMGGDTSIVAEFAGVSEQASVSVAATGGSVTLIVFPPMQSGQVGATVRFQASARLPSGANPDVTATASWSSSAGNIATSLGNGQFRCNAAGAVTAIARFMGAEARGSLQCGSGPATVRELRLSPLNALVVGTRYRLEATAVFADGREQKLNNDQVVWITSDPTLATVDTGGIMQGLRAGTVTITARFSGAMGMESYTFVQR
jgi:uncharacterized protein YjdB